MFESSLKATYNQEDISANLKDVFALLCVHEEFSYSFPSRLLYSLSHGAKEQSGLLQLTSPETKVLLQCLSSTTPELKKVKLKGRDSGPIISLNFDQLIPFCLHLLHMNSNNCISLIEADPLPILITLFTSEVSSIREGVVQLTLELIHSSKHHRPRVLEYLKDFVQFANIEVETEGKILYVLTAK